MRILTIGVLLLFGIQALTAKEVDVKQAGNVAQNFLTEKSETYDGYGLSHLYTETYNGKNVYHVFDGGSVEAFIIISAEDEVYPVLAWSDESNFQRNDIPFTVEDWLLGYAKQIEYIRDKGLKGDETIESAWNTYNKKPANFIGLSAKTVAAGPLLPCEWDQDAWYNAYCPSDIDGPGGKALAGCVATAMGQVMFYYRYPATGTGDYSYYHHNYGTQYADFANTTYRWDEMGDYANFKNHDAIAELLYHLGVSVDMGYSATGSGAYSGDAANALKQFFGYNSSLQLKYKSQYSTTGWQNLLVNNIDSGWPMYYHGYGSGGHAFNVDGYNGTDFFHFNWGWSGSYNGYYYLTSLNPGSNDFTSGQGAIVNFYPDPQNYPNGCSNNMSVTGFAGTIEDGSGPLNDYENNSSCSWLIAPADLCDHIEIDFSYIKTEANSDVIYIYDGATTNDPLLATLSGDTIPNTIVSSGDSVLIVFSTNATNSDIGWRLSYEAFAPIFCSNIQMHTNATGTVSDGSGTFDYNNNSNCKWMIQPPGATSVTLSFSSFDVADPADFLRVYDPSTVPGTLLATYTGTTLPADITSYSGQMLLIFFTDQANTSDGWEATFTSNVGIEELTKANFVISPNPANNFISISCDMPAGKSVIDVYDLQGKLVQREEVNFTGDGSNKMIDISSLNSGVYLLKVQSDQQLQTYRFIKR